MCRMNWFVFVMLTFFKVTSYSGHAVCNVNNPHLHTSAHAHTHTHCSNAFKSAILCVIATPLSIVLHLHEVIVLSSAAYTSRPHTWLHIGLSSTAYTSRPHPWLHLGLSSAAYTSRPHTWLHIGLSSAACTPRPQWHCMGSVTVWAV